jgi:hypothetical protein
MFKNYLSLLKKGIHQMKKTMTEYISALSTNSFDILESIIEKKYQKFITLYWMLKDYSDNIFSLKYKDTKDQVLKIEVELSGIDIDKVMSDLHDSISDDCSVLIYNEKKKIHIEITKEEK